MIQKIVAKLTNRKSSEPRIVTMMVPVFAMPRRNGVSLSRYVRVTRIR